MDVEFHILAYKPDKNKLKRCLNSFEKRQIPFVLCNTEHNIAVSRNKAYQNCKAEFCSYVDDDDEILIEKKAISRLLKSYTDKPIFTNSELYLDSKLIKLMNYSSIVSWSLEEELYGSIKIHQLLIFKTEFIQKLSAQVLNFLITNSLDQNLFDYFIRAFVSTSLGWKYENCVAYRYHTDLSFTNLARATKTVPYKYQLRNLAR